MTRTQIINKLISQRGYEKYLEIGLGDGRNFMGIKVDYKIGVDPIAPDTDMTFGMTSDDYFAFYNELFDIIFIDGLHHSDQVEKDIKNAWFRLRDNGMMILHDVRPYSELMTLVPRQVVEWTGDVYKTAVGFIQAHPTIKTEFFEEPYGLLGIYKSNENLKDSFIANITFDQFVSLNIY